MPKNFSDVLKNRANSLDKLQAKITQLASGGQNFGDEDRRIWTPTVDKDGNGYAVLRLLPAPGEEEIPFVQIWDHGFQGPGGWFIEKSLTTLGQNDPVSEHNSMLWNRNGPGDRDFVSGTPSKAGSKRRLLYYCNAYVVEDPAKPENVGRVVLYRFGKKIFDKLNEAMNPKFPDEPKINPFDLIDGANFKLKIRKYEGYRNYDKSEFDKVAPLFVKADGSPDVEKLEAIWKQEYSLQELVDPKNFKSYAELKNKLNRVLGLDSTNESSTQSAPPPSIKAASSKSDDETPPWNEPAASTTAVDDELAEFQALVNQ